MRVLHICECLPGGPASYLQEVVPYQNHALGIGAVAVLAPNDQVASLGDAARYVKTFTYRQNSRNILSMLRLFLSVRKAIHLFQPDIVHLHSTIAGAVGRLAVLGLRKKPKTIYCAHGWIIDPDRPPRFRWGLVRGEKALARITNQIVNISPHEMTFLRAYGFAEAKMRLIVSGIADKTLPRSGSGPDISPLNMLFIGRLDHQKGFDLLLEAISKVPQAVAMLTIVGDAVRNRRNPAQAISPIRYTGWLKRDEVAKQMADADLVIMPSRWEGMPLVAIEAMRAGKPLIASDRSAFRYLVEDGVTGILVDNQDSGFLASVVRNHTRANFRDMGAKARNRYEKNFKSSRMNEELVALYGELLAAKHDR